jgi:hypothetical protein
VFLVVGFRLVSVPFKSHRSIITDLRLSNLGPVIPTCLTL